MNTTNITYENGITSIGLILISGILGYFTYDSVDGALGMILLTFLFSLSIFLACVPFCGVVIQAVVMHFLIIPFVLNLTGLEQTGLVTGFFCVYLVMGLLITVLMTILTIVGIIEWRT